MKKQLLALLISLGITGWASAPRAQMQFAVTGGLNYSYFNKVPPVSDAFSSLGYMIGVRGSLGSNFFVEPAIQFTSFGSTLITSNDATAHQMRSNYIRVPLEAGVKLFDDFPVNLEARAGIGESFLVGYSDQATGKGQPFTRSDINAMRTTAIIGGGVRVLFLKLDVEYEWGLTDFFKNKGGTDFRAFYIILGGNF